MLYVECIHRRVGYLKLPHVNNTLVDATLQNIIKTFEIRAYYVEGSYADASNVTTSDLDVLLIYKDRFEDDELQKINER